MTTVKMCKLLVFKPSASTRRHVGLCFFVLCTLALSKQQLTEVTRLRWKKMCFCLRCVKNVWNPVVAEWRIWNNIPCKHPEAFLINICNESWRMLLRWCIESSLLKQTTKVWKERRGEKMGRAEVGRKSRKMFPLWRRHPGGQQMGAMLGFQETHEGNQENSLRK